MESYILRLLPTFIVGIPIAYFILRHYFKGSVFFKIGMIWVVNLLFVMVNTSFTSKFPELYPIYISSPIGILTTALLLAYSGKLLRPLRSTTDKLDELAKGNLNIGADKDLCNRNDEIGLISNSIVSLQKKMKDVISEIQSGVDVLSNESKSINKASKEIAENTTDQAASIEEISSSMEEMVANIQQNTENSKQTEVISVRAAQNMKKVSTAAAQSKHAINNIHERIAIINDISFQTNILALNAAVEAARAGEQGRGFAVVAAEVRKLAEKSKFAANEIVDSANSTVKLTDESAKLTDELLPDINSTMKLVQDIVAASIEQSAGAEQVNNAILQLNLRAQDNVTNAEHLNESVNNLNLKANALHVAVNYFKL